MWIGAVFAVTHPSRSSIIWSMLWARLGTHGGGDRVIELLLWSADLFERDLPRHTSLAG